MAEDNELFARTDDIENALNRTQEGDEVKYLIFNSDGIRYGVEADVVNTILNDVVITKIPMMPEYISGIINMRGQFVPIIDFRLLLGRMPGDNSCAVVLNIEGFSIGILVDNVDQMVDIERASILPVPSQRGNKLVSGMCTMPGVSNSLSSAVGSAGTIMILDCSLLAHAGEC